MQTINNQTYKKRGIALIASEETFINLQTFNTVEQLNQAVRDYKDIYEFDLGKNDIRVLDLLKMYSCKYKGVSFLSKSSIADKLELSRRTIIRICQKFESLGIIKQLEMKRKSNMNQTSNAIIIQPIKNVIEDDIVGAIVENTAHDDNDDTSNDTQDNANTVTKCHTKTKHSLKQNLNTRNAHDIFNTHFDSSFISKNVPAKLVDVTSTFFDDAAYIYTIYNRLLTATKSNRDSVYTNLDDYISTFKDCVYKLKKGRVRNGYKGFIGYLYKAFERTCESISNRYVVDYESSYFSWLKSV